MMRDERVGTPVGAKHAGRLIAVASGDHAPDDRVLTTDRRPDLREPTRPRRPDRRERAAPPAAERPDAAHATPSAPAHPRQAVLARRPRAPTRLVPPPSPGHARHRRELAPPGLAAPLALALPRRTRAPAAERGGPRPHRSDRPGQSVLGRRAHPGRAPQARHRRQQALHPAPPTTRAGPTAAPELADLPAQPPGERLGGRSPDRPDRHVPHAVRPAVRQS